jgi:NAD(P)-dependent dehydrogenase (short-subunit alcohol dehydrogenase family)
MSNYAAAVIGGSYGIGAGLLRHYVSEGKPVAAFARSFPTDLSPAAMFTGDITVPETLQPIIGWIAEQPTPRVVLLTAASLGPIGPIQRIDLLAWARAVEVNVVGAARLLSELLPILGTHDRVVLFLGGGIGGPSLQPRVSAYVSSKMALVALIESVAGDAETLVPIVGISPGAYATALTQKIANAPVEMAGRELIDQATNAQRMPMDLSQLLACIDFIASPQGSALNGRIIAVKRDAFEQTSELIRATPDLYRLRRIDGQSVLSAGKW